MLAKTASYLGVNRSTSAAMHSSVMVDQSIDWPAGPLQASSLRFQGTSLWAMPTTMASAVPTA
jgi:hypothetical protein